MPSAERNAVQARTLPDGRIVSPVTSLPDPPRSRREQAQLVRTRRGAAALGQGSARRPKRIADQFADAGIKRVISSPSLRCRQTVEPLAERLGLEGRAERCTGGGRTGRAGRSSCCTDLADEDGDAALCSHGDVIPAVVSALEAEGLDGDGTVDSAKAGAFILETDDGRISQRASTSPPPDLERPTPEPRRTPQTSVTSTRTWASTSARSTANGSTASSWVGLPSRDRPVPAMVGGPDRPSTPTPWATSAGDVVASAQRHASRPITSGGSQPAADAAVRSAATVGPPKAPAPKNSSCHSSTATPALLGPAADERERRSGLGLRVGPRVGEACLARPPGRCAHETLVGGRCEARRGRPRHGLDHRRGRRAASDVKSAVTSGLR